MMSLYAVKTIYRISVKGKVGSGFQKSPISMTEERIVLFKAKSFDAAVKRAEKDAELYAKETYLNEMGKK